MEKPDDMDVWVNERMATLEPAAEWAPDSRKGMAALRGRAATRTVARRRLGWATAAAALGCVVLIAHPGSRAAAQRLWDSLFLGRVDVVRVNFDDIPFSLRAAVSPTKMEAVATVEEASQKAGFAVKLPGPMVVDGLPKLALVAPIAAKGTVNTGELLQALNQAGVRDVAVPPEWDGAHLMVTAGQQVIAEYRDITLMQCRPLRLDTPAGFDLAHFAYVVFRTAGVGAAEARALSRRFVENPAVFLGIPADEAADIREVALAGGTGILIEDFDESGQSARVAVVWNTPDRIFLLSGKVTREFAIAVANSVR